MKKGYFLVNLLFLFFLTILFSPLSVNAAIQSVDNGYAEKIDKYDVAINIKKNRSLEISERILYDFGTNQKHGIYRYVPTYYSGRLGSPYTKLKNIWVTDESGKHIEFTTENSTYFTNIRIGSENSLVSGKKTYLINYTVKNAVGVYNDREELYWDAIGEEWQIPVSNVSVTLTGEGSILEKSNFSCYWGDFGSTDECLKGTVDQQKIEYSVARLLPEQAVTVLSKYPKGTFAAISILDRFIWNTRWYLAIPLLFTALYLRVWWKYGRDPAKSGAIVVQYSPQKGMTPMLAGIIAKPLKGAMSYLSAEVISLAIGGYLKIKQLGKSGFLQIGKDYELIKLKPADSKLADYQKKIFNTFFDGRETVKLSDLRTDTEFGQDIRTVPGLARGLSTEKGYFRLSPVIALTLSLIATGFISFASISIFSFFDADVFSIVILVICIITLLVLSFLMPKRTVPGLKASEYLAGLKTYINYAEKDRIKFLNEPKKSPEKFEELLPYAIVFGLEKEWAKQFEGIYKQPNWYDGNFSTGFTVAALTSDLGGFSSVTSSSTAVSSSSGGGGGFSGGGGGGGGGGSW